MSSRPNPLLVILVAWLVVATCAPASSPSQAGSSAAALAELRAHIKHVVIIMQENRSFDSYFGTYPGADGIPMIDGQPSVCLPAKKGPCVKPYYSTALINVGGPHGETDATADVDGGQMDGFVTEAVRYAGSQCVTTDQSCAGGADVMGYHDYHQIPNYWAYANNFVLQDHMFEPVKSWSYPQHLYMVSAWSARCTDPNDPSSCTSAPENPVPMARTVTPLSTPHFAWTDITYLLHSRGVSWKYYVGEGTQPDCQDDEPTCPQKPQFASTPDIWNPLPYFTTVKQDGQLDQIQPVSNFYSDVSSGSLPAVSWIIPNGNNSEHPPSNISTGQAYVTTLVNAIMNSPEWSSTAIFLSWDDWGGFYDHVPPPVLDGAGYGLRVPGLVISPYAKQGVVDHQVLSHDAYLKFIEDVFLAGARLDPKTDGRPDPRPDVRENDPRLGNLITDFDFNQPAHPPLVLPPHPQPGSTSAG